MQWRPATCCFLVFVCGCGWLLPVCCFFDWLFFVWLVCSFCSVLFGLLGLFVCLFARFFGCFDLLCFVLLCLFYFVLYVFFHSVLYLEKNPKTEAEQIPKSNLHPHTKLYHSISWISLFQIQIGQSKHQTERGNIHVCLLAVFHQTQA